MAWSGNFRSFALPTGEHTLTPIYDHDFDPFQGVEMKVAPVLHMVPPSNNSSSSGNNNDNERKKRMTNDQIEGLERSFQEEMKLEPERKTRLARELRLQPRQVAVWFQNRRARWKTKQLQRLYDALKRDFHLISKEKQKLQEEVMKLKATLEDQSWVTQNSTNYIEASVEQTIDSESISIEISNNFHGINRHQIAQCNYLFNNDDHNPTCSSYWGVLPGCP